MTEPSDNPASERPHRPRKKRPQRAAGREAASKKGQRKGKRQQATVPTRPTLDDQGRERPRFVLDLPDDPELNRLVAAFERGDYRLVRADAERVAKQTEDPAVRRAARDLRRRIDPDPLAKYLLYVAISLLAFLVFWTYFIHAH